MIQMKFKKSVSLLIIFAVAFLLSSCSMEETLEIADKYCEEMIRENAELEKTDEYVQYEELRKKGLINDKGVYSEVETFQNVEEVVETEIRDGSVHITFAENRYAEITYYKDAEKTEQLGKSCWLNPGDSVYANVSVNNPNTNLYKIAAFRVVEYREDDTASWEIPYNGQSLIYSIPDGYTGTELSFLPLGAYDKRILMLNVKDAATDSILHSAGTWLVNDKKYTETSIPATESFVVKFDFNEKDYFYVDASPKPFTKDPNSSKTGYVEFDEIKPTDPIDGITIFLHEYLELELRFPKGGTVTFNGETSTIKKNKTWSSDKKLKFGDVIEIETDGDCIISGGDYRFIEAVKDKIGATKSRYRLTVKKTPSDIYAHDLLNVIACERTFIVNLSSRCDHGKCEWTLDGKKVSGKVNVKEGQTLKVTYSIKDDASFASDAGNIIEWGQQVALKSRTEEVMITEAIHGKTLYADDLIKVE